MIGRLRARGLIIALTVVLLAGCHRIFPYAPGPADAGGGPGDVAGDADRRVQGDIPSDGHARAAARVLFVVDTSQSTAVTDPQMLRESEPRRAVELWAANPDVSFAVIQFATTAQALTGFTKDTDKLNLAFSALRQFAGVTTFSAGTAAALALLTDDVAQSKPVGNGDTRYVVFFIADGPDAGNHASTLRDVGDIVKLGASVKEVRFHTALISVPPIDPVAAGQLQGMVKAGSGTFTNYGAGQTIDFVTTIAP